jgi:hypothetical protein
MIISRSLRLPMKWAGIGGRVGAKSKSFLENVPKFKLHEARSLVKSYSISSLLEGLEPDTIFISRPATEEVET